MRRSLFKYSSQKFHETNLALSREGDERQAMLEFYPALEKARKETGGIFSSRRSAIKGVLKPLAKAYKAQLGD